MPLPHSSHQLPAFCSGTSPCSVYNSHVASQEKVPAWVSTAGPEARLPSLGSGGWEYTLTSAVGRQDLGRPRGDPTPGAESWNLGLEPWIIPGQPEWLAIH